MKSFPEEFTPDNFTNKEEQEVSHLRRTIFDSVSKKVEEVYSIPVSGFDVKALAKVRNELEALGWEVKMTDFQHLNQTSRSLKIANPMLVERPVARRGAFGGGGQARNNSAFARQNMGGANKPAKRL
jgi:hypothetical protein